MLLVTQHQITIKETIFSQILSTLNIQYIPKFQNPSTVQSLNSHTLLNQNLLQLVINKQLINRPVTISVSELEVCKHFRNILLQLRPRNSEIYSQHSETREQQNYPKKAPKQRCLNLETFPNFEILPNPSEIFKTLQHMLKHCAIYYIYQQFSYILKPETVSASVSNESKVTSILDKSIIFTGTALPKYQKIQLLKTIQLCHFQLQLLQCYHIIEF
eukprot:TRINITY_DN5449_c0_g2_i2.p1 TRINITY_DN5449_c0_g2~~TRINITY_DN5449_c0_g2_i2.p1  ORF type:complete len:250 (-),score=-28.66 TRINITY_DN5449_c0_g2_i2:228-875(-)